MLRISILLLILITTSNVLAQNVSFEYDNAGNRVKRLASSPPQPGCDFTLKLAQALFTLGDVPTTSRSIYCLQMTNGC